MALRQPQVWPTRMPNGRPATMATELPPATTASDRARCSSSERMPAVLYAVAWYPAAPRAASTRPQATTAKSGPVACTMMPTRKTVMPVARRARRSQLPAAAAMMGEPRA